jgi:hypothetical protein
MDAVDNPDDTLRFYMALRKAQVPAELHLYAHGPRIRRAADKSADHALAGSR